MKGTSMATPIAAGNVAQIRQYFVDGYYPSGRAVCYPDLCMKRHPNARHVESGGCYPIALGSIAESHGH